MCHWCYKKYFASSKRMEWKKYTHECICCIELNVFFMLLILQKKESCFFRSSTIATFKVIITQPQLSTFLFYNTRDLHNLNCIAKTTNLRIPSLIWNRKKSTIPVCMSVSFINLNTISILCTFAVYLLSTFQKMYGICPPIC